MATGYSSPEDICNAALREAGYPRSIADLYEGSRAARVALEIYGQTRDKLLQAGNWSFAQRETTLTAITDADPLLGFTNAYLFPADGLRIKQMHASIPTPNYNPQPVFWTVANDTSTDPPRKVVYTKGDCPKAVYIGQVTAPTAWNPGFTKALVDALAETFAFALKDDPQFAQTRAAIAGQTRVEAVGIDDGAPPGMAGMVSAPAARS